MDTINSKEKTDNELIAEFMGYSKCVTEHDTFWNTMGRTCTPEDWQFHSTHLKYDTSWDWLMPVVEKIEKFFTEQIDQFNKPRDVQREADTEFSKVVCLGITAGIDNTYKAVVEFIKWHNTQAL